MAVLQAPMTGAMAVTEVIIWLRQHIMDTLTAWEPAHCLESHKMAGLRLEQVVLGEPTAEAAEAAQDTLMAR